MGRSRQDFWGTCSAIHGESARPVPSSATLTDHERSKRKSRFTKQDTDGQTDSSLLPADRVTPAGAAPTRTCGARAADMEALRLPVLSVLPTTRAVGLLYWLRKVACFLIFTSITKKQCQISFWLKQHFRFFLFIFGSSRGGAGGVECVWAQPLLRCRDNLAYLVILFTMF